MYSLETSQMVLGLTQAFLQRSDWHWDSVVIYFMSAINQNHIFTLKFSEKLKKKKEKNNYINKEDDNFILLRRLLNCPTQFAKVRAPG